MWTPADVRAKAVRLYPKLLEATVAGRLNEAFPWRLHGADLALEGAEMVGAIAQVAALREGSKQVRGFGYSVEYRERQRGRDAARFGRNLFPQRILLETPDDLVRLIGKQQEYAAFTAALDLIGGRLPSLLGWVRRAPRKLAACAADAGGLVEVCEYLLAHPRPQLFTRELPLSVDSKFIERHEGVLREWLDLLLPPSAVDATEASFARRYGLREVEPHRLVRSLDPALTRELGFPADELSLPPETLATLAVPGDVRVLVVENQVNLLTLPFVPRGLALHGGGYAVASWRRVPWLADVNLTYWGDLDVDGLVILSQFRGQFPRARSLWMDDAALERWRERVGRAPPRNLEMPPHLTADEQAAFVRCRQEHLRLEQERIDHATVCGEFGRRFTP